MQPPPLASPSPPPLLPPQAGGAQREPPAAATAKPAEARRTNSNAENEPAAANTDSMEVDPPSVEQQEQEEQQPAVATNGGPTKASKEAAGAGGASGGGAKRRAGGSGGGKKARTPKPKAPAPGGESDDDWWVGQTGGQALKQCPWQGPARHAWAERGLACHALRCCHRCCQACEEVKCAVAESLGNCCWTLLLGQQPAPHQATTKLPRLPTLTRCRKPQRGDKGRGKRRLSEDAEMQDSEATGRGSIGLRRNTPSLSSFRPCMCSNGVAVGGWEQACVCVCVREGGGGAM